MNPELQIAANIIIIILLLTVLLLKGWASQKGKNLADKQDIADLTKIVEDIKNNNSKEIELLKSNLSLWSEKGKVMFNEERQVVIELYSKIATWGFTRTRATPIDRLEMHIDYDNYRNVHETFYNESSMLFFRLGLLIGNEELISLFEKTILSVRDYSSAINEKLFDLRNLLLKKDELTQELNCCKDYEYLHVLKREKLDIEKRISSIVDEFYKSLDKEFKDFGRCLIQLGDSAKAFVRKWDFDSSNIDTPKSNRSSE